ncbi:YhgE/Pip domain-containing protein [Bacillus sp. JJ722]|uniref:YhgE/Pip domain-containing protein n=1 Tax=Bacillus sp. JJ722 TaxID=3122973 RepID=UPI003000D7E2
MRKVLHIYRLDWRRIYRSKAAIFLIVALMFLPSLYAWFNIKALWDPYGNTAGIKIAVANDDKGTTVEGEKLNIGYELINKLKENENLGWTFVSKEQADSGVTNGDYYASLYIPKDFSESLSSILSEHPKKAEIVFTINDKINAITPKITATGANAITAQVTKEFVNTVSKSLLTAFDKIGIELEKDLPTIRKMETKLYQIQDALPQINEFGQEMIKLEKDLPAIQAKANKVIGLTSYIPEINAAGQSILKIQDALPVLEEAGQQVLLLQEKIPEIRNMAAKVNEFNDNFGIIKDTLNKGLTEANQAMDVINSTQALLPQIEQLANNSEKYVGIATQFTDSLSASFDEIAKAVRLNLVLVNQIAKNTTIVTSQLVDSNISPEQVESFLNTTSELLNEQQKVLQNQMDHMQGFIDQGIAPDQMNELLQSLQTLKDRVQKQQGLVQNAISLIQSNGSELPTVLQNINNEAKSIQQLTDNVLGNFDSTYLPAIQNGLNKIQNDIKTANDVVIEAQKQLPNVKNLLGDTEQTLQTATTMLKKYQEELPQLESTLQNATNVINANVDKVINEVNFAANFYQNDFGVMRNQVNKGSEFVKKDLPGLEKDLQHATQLIKENVPKLVEAVQMAADLSRTELPQLTKSINTATEKLNEVKKQISIEEVIDLLRTDIKADSDFIANPVNLKEVREFPVANYGSASSPFYTALAIWVGALLLVSMLSVDVHMPKEMYKPHHFYFGRGLTFLTIALIQAAIVSLGNIFLLGVDIHMKLAFVLFSLLISFVFVTIVYTLVSIFGNIGKGLAIVLLVLQISSSGGNFPIEVSSPFFQHIYPFLPFTYAVKLLREALGGAVWYNAITYMLVLICIALIFIVIGTMLKKPLMKVVNRFTENAEKSKIFH